MTTGPFESDEEQETFARAYQDAMRKLPKNIAAVLVLARVDNPGRSSIMVNPSVNVEALLQLGLDNFTKRQPVDVVAFPCADPNCPHCKMGLH
jgi:hypothetical protein